MTSRQQKGRRYGHVTILKFPVSRDAAHRAGLSATAELLVLNIIKDHLLVFYSSLITKMIANST